VLPPVPYRHVAGPHSRPIDSASSGQAAAGFQIGEEAVHFCVAVQTRQLLANIVGQELDFGGGDRFGVAPTAQVLDLAAPSA